MLQASSRQADRSPAATRSGADPQAAMPMSSGPPVHPPTSEAAKERATRATSTPPEGMSFGPLQAHASFMTQRSSSMTQQSSSAMAAPLPLSQASRGAPSDSGQPLRNADSAKWSIGALSPRQRAPGMHGALHSKNPPANLSRNFKSAIWDDKSRGSLDSGALVGDDDDLANLPNPLMPQDQAVHAHQPAAAVSPPGGRRVSDGADMPVRPCLFIVCFLLLVACSLA